MSTFVGYILILIALINAAIVVVPYLMGRADLLTIRNFFLLGFTIYQVTSGTICLFDVNSFESSIIPMDQDSIAVEYLLWIVTFELVFFLFYGWGIGAKRAAKLTPLIKGQVREPVLWIFAFTLLGVAFILRLSVFIPYVAIITGHVGTSIAGVAAGLAAWVWVRRPFNPAAAALMFAVLFAATAISITGGFGRRPIVAVAGCLLWGTYYSRWRGLSPVYVVGRAAIFGIIPIILISKYTAARGQFIDANPTTFSRLKMIATADTRKGFMDLVSGQQCAAWSMWLMEMHPESLEYNNLHSFIYYFEIPIPRAIYPDKPEALALTAWKDAGVEDMPPQFTIGPGVLGHAGAEGGYPALVFYAAVLGLFIRYFDSLLARAPVQPFVALPVGSSLGNLLGMPRGELANFAFEFTVGVLGALIILIAVARTLKMMGFITDDDFQHNDEYELDEHGQPVYYDEYQDSYDGLYDPTYANYGDENR